MTLYLAICVISWRGAAIGAAVDAVQCACGDIMSGELIKPLCEAKIKGEVWAEIKNLYFVELGMLIPMVCVSTPCDLPILRMYKSKLGCRRHMISDVTYPQNTP